MDLSYRRRASRPKVRSGCHTCKIRHIKCDEARPVCTRCLKSKLDCDGYPHNRPKPTRRTGPKGPTRSILPKDESLVREPRISVFEDESEYRYFDFFLTQASSCLGCFEMDGAEVWVLARRLLLQISYQEEFARRGILAIAGLNRIVEAPLPKSAAKIDTAVQISEEKQHRSFALKQYVKALHLMRQTTATTTLDDYRLRNILVACLITTYVECYQGNHEEAVKQSMIGINLVQAFQKQRFISQSPSSEIRCQDVSSVIDTDIVTAYSYIENMYKQ